MDSMSKEENTNCMVGMAQAFRRVMQGEMAQAFRDVSDGGHPRFILEKAVPYQNPNWDVAFQRVDNMKPNPISAENCLINSLSEINADQEFQEEITEYGLALKSIGKYSFKFYDDSIYYFDGVAYRNITENDAIGLIKQSLNKDMLYNTNFRYYPGVLKQILTERNLRLDEWPSMKNQNRIPFKNGVFDLTLKKLVPASSLDYIKTYIANDFNYNLNDMTGGYHIEKFFEECSCGDKEWKDIAWAIMGAIIGTAQFKKFFYLFGVPNSGKSVFCRLLEQLIGINSISFLAMDKLNGRFDLAVLIDKKLNICSDERSEPLKNISNFKKLTSGGLDSIIVERKHRNHVVFKTDMIKFLIASNHPPKLSNLEDVDAFFERMILLPFMRSVPERERDDELLNKLLAEKDYILNKAVRAYEKLLINNKIFPECNASYVLKTQWRYKLDMVDLFVNDFCELDWGYKTSNNLLYTGYEKYCNLLGEKPEQRDAFIEKLRIRFRLDETRVNEGNSKLRGTRGIRLKKLTVETTLTSV